MDNTGDFYSLNVGSIPASRTSFTIWGYSSAGRAVALQAKGHRFDPVYLHQTIRSVAQPGSALALGARGPRFESLYSDQLILDIKSKTRYNV